MGALSKERHAGRLLVDAFRHQICHSIPVIGLEEGIGNKVKSRNLEESRFVKSVQPILEVTRK
jgi:hypothetical protein